ncbi:MAG: PepSY-associated TM helix domain-containing protein [Acidobacteriota bacterium]|jgi:hypothetical protein|nr:PepSY-associated TM helix domain-containing protein [Acidobacteriaceae bacterium]
MSKSPQQTWNTEKLRAEPARGAWRRRTATAARWLHIYGSMVSLSLLLLFSVTGLTLNHADWFADAQRTAQFRGQVPTAWTKGELAKLEIVEHLRGNHGIKTGLSEFRAEEGQAAVSFKGPGYTADVVMDRATGRYEVTETRMGLAAVLNDLHKGRDTGPAWSLLLDVSAGLMVLVSASGLVLLWYLQRKRVAGLWTLVGGTLACYLVYAIWVP